MDGSNGLVVRGVSWRLRWSAVGAGLALVPICFGLTLYELVLPVLLIVGAILAGRWPAVGRWLMSCAAVLLGVLVFPFCVTVLLHLKERPVGSSDINWNLISLGCAASVIFLSLCVVTLVLDFVKGRKRLDNSD